jgi:hypothetical protein
MKKKGNKISNEKMKIVFKIKMKQESKPWVGKY